MEEKTPTACMDREKLPFLVGVQVPRVMEWSLDSAVGDQLADVDPLADVDLLWKRKFGEQNVFIPETL